MVVRPVVNAGEVWLAVLTGLVAAEWPKDKLWERANELTKAVMDRATIVESK